MRDITVNSCYSHLCHGRYSYLELYFSSFFIKLLSAERKQWLSQRVPLRFKGHRRF